MSTAEQRDSILGEDNPNSETLDLGVLGAIVSPVDIDGYSENWEPGTKRRVDCGYAVALGEPDCIPSEWPLLDQKYSLRELIEGAAQLARLAQDVCVSLADDGRPLDRSFAHDVSATETLRDWVAQRDSPESGERLSALRAAGFLAHVFSLDPVVEGKRDRYWKFWAGMNKTAGKY